MPQSVIDRVNFMAADQPRIITFLDKHGMEIGVETEPDVINPAETVYELPGVVGDISQIPGVDTASAIEDTAVEDCNKNETDGKMNDRINLPDTHRDPPIVDDRGNDIGNDLNPEFDDSGVTTKERSNERTIPTPRKPKLPTETVVPEQSKRIWKEVQKYVPSMKGKTYGYTAAQISSTEFEPQIIEMVLTQLTLKAAIKMWGNEAEAEMKQLHWRNTFKPVHWSELTSKQKETILESHIFLTKKRTGEIKGRTVAGGNKQRDYIQKEDASSPTVATESVILTSIIDAIEERHCAVIDIPNAFIQTVVKDKKRRVIIRIRGMLVDMLVKIAPEVYKTYVITDRKGNKQILVECLNALYGTMVASLLYYEKFTKSLKANGYEMNPYDACVWNKEIDGKQCTICFHVDDCKISQRTKRKEEVR